MAIRNILIALAWTLAACACLCLAPPADAGWGACSGTVVPEAFASPLAPAAVAHAYEWRDYPDRDPRYKALMDGATHVGTWDYTDRAYYPMLAPSFGDAGFGLACTPPVPPPPDRAAATPACQDGCACDRCRDGCRCKDGAPCGPGCVCTKKATSEPIQNFGLVLDKINAGPQERYTLNGQQVGRVEAMAALAPADPKPGPPPATVPDDSSKPSLTAIGTAEECAAAKAALPADVLAAVCWQDYRPDDVMVRKFGFVTSGKPGPELYLQSPDGRVLCRQDAPDAPAMIEAVRRACPDYHPERDPDGKPADPAALLASVPAWAWVAGGGVLLLAVLARRGQ